MPLIVVRQDPWRPPPAIGRLQWMLRPFSEKTRGRKTGRVMEPLSFLATFSDFGRYSSGTEVCPWGRVP